MHNTNEQQQVYDHPKFIAGAVFGKKKATGMEQWIDSANLQNKGDPKTCRNYRGIMLLLQIIKYRHPY